MAGAAASSLAERVRSLSGADLGLGVTGEVAHQEEQDHVACIALASPTGTEVLEQKWPFALRYVENRVTKTALAKIRKYLVRRG